MRTLPGLVLFLFNGVAHGPEQGVLEEGPVLRPDGLDLVSLKKVVALDQTRENLLAFLGKVEKQ